VLKAVGVAVLLIDHYGLYFDPDQTWWRVFGRMAAPIFFFLIGFARTRSVPWTWIAFGAVLTALDVWTSWADDGLRDLNLDILLHFAVLRFAVLPVVEQILLRRPAAPFLVIGCGFLIPLSDRFLEYGTSGWLWAFLGLSHRLALENPCTGRRWMRLALALAAAGVYVFREAIDHELSAAQAITLCGLMAGLTAGLLAFRRTVLRVQLPASFAWLVRFCGRYSLEIYAITLFAMRLLGHVLDTDEATDSGDDDSDSGDDDD
jgi:hypothetical protein